MTPLEAIVPTCIFCGTNCKVGYGNCHCECGEQTKICTMTSRKFGVKQGYPCRYVLGHQSKIRPIIVDALPFKIDGVYCRLIPLTRGLWTIVDEVDYIWLMRSKWFAKQDKKGNCYYAVRHADGNHKAHIYMHREVAGIIKPDHKNRNTLDNRRDNVRPASSAQNMQNTKKPVTNKSGYKGVSWHKAGLHKLASTERKCILDYSRPLNWPMLLTARLLVSFTEHLLGSHSSAYGGRSQVNPKTIE